MNARTVKTKSWWPVGLITFFVIFISWIATFIVIAVSSSWDLVTPDYYEQEVRYQERIDSMKRVNGTSGFSVSHDADTGVLVAQFPREHSGSMTKGTIKMYRPDNAKLDQLLKLNATNDGRQLVSTASLARGPWKVEASWSFGGESYFASTNMILGKPMPVVK